MNKNESEKKDSKDCLIALKGLSGSNDPFRVTLNEKDTIETFVKKIEPEIVSMGLANKGDILNRLSYNGCNLLDNWESDSSNKSTTLWDKIGEKWDKISKRKNVKLEFSAVFIFGGRDGQHGGVKINCPAPKSLGQLPLYKVVAKEDPIDLDKKYNTFEETGEFVELSTRKQRLQYKGFSLGSRQEGSILKAANPAYRYICSEHLQTQKSEGRLANAQAVLNHQIGGFDNMSKDDAKERGIGVQKVPKQNGWQGINADEYVKAYDNDILSYSQAYIDAEGWYNKLSDIALDKAYLSVDKNLDTLISAADKLFDSKEIDLEHFANVSLMLRYACELRKLPNEKDGKLKSVVEPIELSSKSCKVIHKILDKIGNELENLWNLWKDETLNNPANEGGSNWLNEFKKFNLNWENQKNEENEETIKNIESASTQRQNSVSENKSITTISNAVEAARFVVTAIELQKQLKKELEEKQLKYKDELIDCIKNNNKKVEKSNVNWFQNFGVKKTVSLDDKDKELFVNKIEALYKKTKNNFDKFLDETKCYAERLDDFDKNKFKLHYLKSNYNRDEVYFFVKDFLSKSELTRLSELEKSISETNKRLTKLEDLLDSDRFKNISKYCEMYALAGGVLKCIKQSRKLSWFQWFVNCLLSLGFHFDYRFYKIGNEMSFNNDDDIFAKYNSNRQEEEKTIDGIPQSIFIEIYNR